MRKASFWLFALSLVIGFNGAVWAQGKPDVWVGSWKLNVAKSSYAPGGAPLSVTSKIEAVPGGIKVSSENVSNTGNTVRTEYTAKFDGVDVAVTGAAPGSTAALKRIDDYTYEVVQKAGPVVTVSRNVISRDGKTRTVTAKLTIGGKENTLTQVFDRE